MNIGQLEYELMQTAMDPMSYSIGDFADDCACIMEADDGMWETFVGQRGKKDDLQRWILRVMPRQPSPHYRGSGSAFSINMLDLVGMAEHENGATMTEENLLDEGLQVVQDDDICLVRPRCCFLVGT